MLGRLGAGAGGAGFSSAALRVLNDPARQRFTVAVPGALHSTAVATLDYDKKNNSITFIHTNVPQEFQGKGVGKLLAKSAFDFAKTNQLSVLCQCHFLHKFYLDNKSSYKDLNIKFDLAEL